MSTNTAKDSTNLDALRREIDAVDGEIHGLLMRRAEVIEQLIAAKRLGERGAAFRPGREATMMRALRERHAGPLPLSIVEHLWREIIGTFTQLQAPYRVLSSRAEDPRVRDLLRYAFGFSAPLVATASDSEAVATVARTGTDLAVVVLDGPLDERWWVDIDLTGEVAPDAGIHGAKVIAALPFLPPSAGLDFPAALILGPADVDAPTEACIYALSLAAQTSASVLESFGVLLAYGTAGALLASDRTPAEINSVLAPAAAVFGTVTWIGNVAAPYNWTFG